MELSVWDKNSNFDGNSEDAGPKFLGGRLIPLEHWIRGKEEHETWYRELKSKSTNQLKHYEKEPIFTYNFGKFEGDIVLYDKHNEDYEMKDFFSSDELVSMYDGSWKLAEDIHPGMIYMDKTYNPKVVISTVKKISSEGSEQWKIVSKCREGFPLLNDSANVGKCLLLVKFDATATEEELVAAERRINLIADEKKELLRYRNNGQDFE
jgi:hypothetical protein